MFVENLTKFEKSTKLIVPTSDNVDKEKKSSDNVDKGKKTSDNVDDEKTSDNVGKEKNIRQC